MFEFEKEQKEFDIDGVKFGGRPWKNPTVLIGTLFYEGHSIVSDMKKGIFDREKAKEKLEMLSKLSAETGNPTLLDVFGATSEALMKYIDFIADETKFPFLIDSADSKALLSAAKHAIEGGLKSRVIYNSINYKTSEEELNSLRSIGLECALVAATNVTNPTVEGRLECLRGFGDEEGLLEKAKKGGIEKVLVDVSMIDAPDVGPASKTIYLVKKEFGLPAGVGSTNFVVLWRKGKGMERRLFEICRTAGILFPVPVGADFILYGPVEWAPSVYYACGLFNAFMGYTLRFEGVSLPEGHPITRMMR